MPRVLLSGLSCPPTLLTVITAQSGLNIRFKVAILLFTWPCRRHSPARPVPPHTSGCTRWSLCAQVIPSPLFPSPMFG